mmetsp:Transcript_3399/g.10075  ORF Transcript_3399/g.10075 Transcript_3399/m.10075 type:complete len:225 (-) Transcript_3399:260-934(-)
MLAAAAAAAAAAGVASAPGADEAARRRVRRLFRGHLSARDERVGRGRRRLVPPAAAGPSHRRHPGPPPLHAAHRLHRGRADADGARPLSLARPHQPDRLPRPPLARIERRDPRGDARRRPPSGRRGALRRRVALPPAALVPARARGGGLPLPRRAAGHRPRDPARRRALWRDAHAADHRRSRARRPPDRPLPRRLGARHRVEGAAAAGGKGTHPRHPRREPLRR